jgi:hypothetical protein
MSSTDFIGGTLLTFQTEVIGSTLIYLSIIFDSLIFDSFPNSVWECLFSTLRVESSSKFLVWEPKKPTHVLRYIAFPVCVGRDGTTP